MPNDEALTAVDYIAAFLAAVAALGPVSMLYWSPRFAEMYAEIEGPLPALTKLGLQPWFGPLIALVPAALLIAGVTRTSLPIVWRRVLIVGSFFVGCCASALCVWAMYAPLFELSGAIE